LPPGEPGALVRGGRARQRRRRRRDGEAVRRRLGGGRVRGGCQRSEREEACRDRSQRRNDQSLFPRKFSGVTTTIAIAWATISPSPSQTSSDSTPRFAK